MSYADVSRAKGGDVFNFSYDAADVAQKFVFEEDNWGPYLAEDVEVADTVRPSVDMDEVSLPGKWTSSITLFHVDEFSSAHVVYEGEGFTLDYTLDGVTWTALPQNGVIDLGDDPDFFIRATFAGGMVEDPAELIRLTVYVLKTDSIRSERSRSGVFTTDRFTSEGMILDDGRLLVPSGSGEVWGTIELWVRYDHIPNGTNNMILQSASGQWVGLNAAGTATINGGTTVYIDGVARVNGVTVPLRDGEFHHYVIVRNDAPADTSFYLGIDSDGTSNPTDLTISHLSVYPDKMTSAQAQELYTAQVGSVLIVNDSGGINVSESATPYDIYAYTWSIVGGSH